MGLKFSPQAPATALRLPSFECTLHHTHHDCECCGYFVNVDCTLQGPSTLLEFGSDGHFGGGSWDGDIAGPCKVILKLLGVSLFMQSDQDPEAGIQPVDLGDARIYDAQRSGYDGLVPLEIQPLPGLVHGLSKITAVYRVAPTMEHCGEYLVFLNDDAEPFATFVGQGLSKPTRSATHVEYDWGGREFDAIEWVLKKLGVLKVRETSTSTFLDSSDDFDDDLD